MNQTINQTLVETSQFLGVSIPFTSSVILDIYIITLFVALFITLINKYLTDQVKIKALRKEMKDIQKKMKSEMANNPKKAQQMQKELMQKNMENMKQAFNPKIMLATALPLLLVFSFIGKYYSPFGIILDFGLGVWFFGHPWEWLGTYIVFSIINSIALKKILKVA